MATVAETLEKDWPELNEEQVVEAISKESRRSIAEAAEGGSECAHASQARRFRMYSCAADWSTTRNARERAYAKKAGKELQK